MNRKKEWGILVVALLAVFSLTTYAWAAEPIVIKFGHAGAANLEDPMHAASTWFATEIDKRTGGKIKVSVFGGMVLGGEKEMLDGIKMGSIQMGDISNAPMGMYVPMSLLWDLPFIIDSTEHAHKVFDSWIGDQVREKFVPLGVRILHFDE
jgi:TRAP-type C4-dicarboxylate transport system substrate-binding protein